MLERCSAWEPVSVGATQNHQLASLARLRVCGRIRHVLLGSAMAALELRMAARMLSLRCAVRRAVLMEQTAARQTLDGEIEPVRCQ